VVHKKTATALALTAVKNEDQREFAKLVESFKVGAGLGAGWYVLLGSKKGPCWPHGQCAAGGEQGHCRL
jgi:hypothetical protein